MKKDIEWAKKEIKELMTEESQNYPHDEMVEKEMVLGILNQLDEPEVLSHDWIDEHKYFPVGEDAVVRARDLRKLLVSKQEELESRVKVLIEACKQEEGAYGERENGWISGFIKDLKNLVEEEQKYYVLVRDEEYGGFWFLYKKNNGNISIGINRNYSEIDWVALKLTEQEIKDYDERFWAFAVLKGECQ